jgi:hypothetical protein
MNPPESQNHADLLHRALRDLPDITAPRSLEERVLAGIAARAALPWWRQSAAAWPQPARIALVATCLAAAAGLTQLMTTGIRDGAAAARGAEAWLAPVSDSWAALHIAANALSGTVALVPPVWLFGLAATAALSAALLGGGIAAYRALCVRN